MYVWLASVWLSQVKLFNPLNAPIVTLSLCKFTDTFPSPLYISVPVVAEL